MKGGIDLGGTKIQAVVTNGGAEVAGSARRPTPRGGGPAAVASELAATLRDALESAGADVASLSGVGIGSPGVVDPGGGTVAKVVNVDGWIEPFPLAEVVGGALGVPAAVANDVSVAAEAERLHGAGRDFRSFLGVFWGTGVGGGIILDGVLWHGRGSAGEIGHVIAKPGGRLCACGLHGCVEAYAGRGALERRAREAVEDGRTTVLFEIAEKRGRERLTSGVWLRALDAEDDVARELIESAVEALGVGVGSALSLLDVEAVVIGGGLGERLGPDWLDRIRAAVLENTFGPSPPEFRLAELGDLGGAIGASLLVR